MVTKFTLADNPYNVAEKYFNLKLPCTLMDLKTAFRIEAKKLHTDTSGKDTKDAFIEVKAAYDFLSECVEFVSAFESGGISEQVKIEGKPLSFYGLGLGPNQNGKDCPDCNRAGYKTVYANTFKPCADCDSDGCIRASGPCRYCSGTGKFIQRRTKAKVNCRACNGTGNRSNAILCPNCFGLKQIHVPGKKLYYEKCYKCKGTGEIPVWNPVIPKGRLWA